VLDFKIPEPEQEKQYKISEIKLYEFDLWLTAEIRSSGRHHKVMVAHISKELAEEALLNDIDNDELLSMFEKKIEFRKEYNNIRITQ